MRLRETVQDWVRPLMQPRVLSWKLCAALIALIHLVALALLLRIEFNNAPELYFPASAPATVLDREIRAEFPNDELLIALFSGEGLYGEPALTALTGVAERLRAVAEVDRVFFVTTVDHIAGSADGFVVEPLVDPARLGDRTPEARLERVLRDRFAPGWLATDDGESLALIVRARKLHESRERKAV